MTGMARPRTLVTSFLFAFVIGPVQLSGQRDANVAEPFPVGEIVPRVITAVNVEQSYALYLPSNYTTEQTWPVLILMDPRGRALIPLRPMVDAAERHGYILVSSYNTASDGPLAPNEEAVAALLDDVPNRFAINTQRIYFMGFSGTARTTWDFAFRLKQYVAGIVGIGGGLPPSFPLNSLVMTEGAPFVFFGGSGTTDFNYEEMRELDVRLDQVGMTHQIAFFSGPHSWPPKPMFARILDWLELHAVKRGLAVRDDAWIDALLANNLADEERLEAEGKPYEAWQRYAAVLQDFGDLRDLEQVNRKVQDLDRSQPVRRVRETLDRMARRQLDYEKHFYKFLEDVKTKSIPSLDDAVNQLRIAELLEGASHTKDSVAALGYQRIIEIVFVRTSFYEPRTYIEQGDLERALLMTLIAGIAKPNNPRVCNNLGGLYAQMGRADEAFEALECLVASSSATVAALQANTMLKPLRADPRYGALLARLRRP